ncbi:hypothetical protein CCR95_14315 [Thiocystis minor]|uniref:toprim domain-containing protein n=1 Tax=Thiocystis minor TaxID=61597 RepID=UPI00191136D3|nr:toprim domain-containing protein [Thiocystis minor]MBK5965230.1 hypothetical protein [Thiocystis minor]
MTIDSPLKGLPPDFCASAPSLTTWQAIDAFAEAIASAGLGNPDIIADGALHRFRTDDDKPGKLSGWYTLHLDRLPAGVFGSWKLGLTETWCAKARDEMTPREHYDFRGLIEQAKRQRDAERARQHQAGAEKAGRIWDHAEPADPTHPYLRKKGIQPHGIRQQGIGLIVPVMVEGQITSLQTIYPDGAKRFLSGGRMSGGAYRIDDAVTRPEILIAEGFATGASLHEEIGAAVWCTFNCNNLLPVAKTIRRLNPEIDIVICGDDDQWTEGNPGRTKAKAAAIAIGARLLMPDFSVMDLSTRPTDWNDWYQLRRQGREASV